MTVFRPVGYALALLAFSWQPLRAADPPTPAEPTEVSYYRDIRPIFQQNCQGCHQPAKPSGGYVMTSHAALLKKTDTDQTGILPGQPNESSVIDQIVSREGKPPLMPKGKDPLTDFQVNLIK